MSEPEVNSTPKEGSERYMLICLRADLHDLLRGAAARRRISKRMLVQRLLTNIVTDHLIEAVLDDEPRTANERNARTQ